MNRVLPVVVEDALVLGDNGLPYSTVHINSRVDGGLLQQLYEDLLSIKTSFLGKNLRDEEKTIGISQFVFKWNKTFIHIHQCGVGNYLGHG